MGYSTQPGFPSHHDCANFQNGLCTLNGVAVDPHGAACPSFTPKSIMATPQVARAYRGARQPYQSYPPQITQSYPPYMLPPPVPHYPPQTGYGLPPPYAYPPWIGYGHGYPAPQYRRGYSYPPPYPRPPRTWYGYRRRYSSGPGPSALTAPRRGGAGFAPVPPRARGGRMGGFGAGGGRGGGRGRGRMGGFAAGPRGFCVCPSCGYSTPHAISVPCYQQTCPRCGSGMTRGG